MTEQRLNVRSVAVIGAGVSGVAAAIHLKRAGLDVKVYERTSRAGGVWVYNEQTAKDAAYPSTTPSTGDSPEYDSLLQCSRRRDSPMSDCRSPEDHQLRSSDQGKLSDPSEDLLSSFAPPGPCYVALRNNVSTIEMEMSFQRWKPDTDEFVSHNVLADYIQDGAVANGVLDCFSFNSRVTQVRKTEPDWEVDVDQLVERAGALEILSKTERFDAVEVAAGHYHACNVPDLPGLAAWKRSFPDSVHHSKLYRRPERFAGKNVLLIGAGVSSIDIAKDLGPIARSVYQSSRGGMYDIPSHVLPDNAARIGAVKAFEAPSSSRYSRDGSVPGKVILESGEELCGIHHVILCTGYHVSLPFMQQYHSDGTEAIDASDEVLVTNGQQVHNLHKDIWYIPDPTLAFIGVPYHVATYSFFEFQAMAVAAVFSGRTELPSQVDMRQEYQRRIAAKGAGRTFHSMKGDGQEIAYVDDLVAMVNVRKAVMSGHTDAWHAAYARRKVRQQALFAKGRDTALDRKVMEMVVGC